MRQPQFGEDKPRSLVHGIVRTVTIGELRRFKAAGDLANELLDVHKGRESIM